MAIDETFSIAVWQEEGGFWRTDITIDGIDHHSRGETIGIAVANLGGHLMAVDENSRQSMIAGFVADLAKI